MIRCSLNSYHFPGKPVRVTYQTSAEFFFFPNIQSELPLTSFYFLGSCHWSPDRWDHHLALCCSPWRSCRLWWGHPLALFSLRWTSPVTSAALHVHFPFKIFHQLRCCPLDTLQQCDPLILWLPKLHTRPKVRLYQHRAERDNHPLMGWWYCAWCTTRHGWPFAARALLTHIQLVSSPNPISRLSVKVNIKSLSKLPCCSSDSRTFCYCCSFPNILLEWIVF